MVKGGAKGGGQSGASRQQQGLEQLNQGIQTLIDGLNAGADQAERERLEKEARETEMKRQQEEQAEATKQRLQNSMKGVDQGQKLMLKTESTPLTFKTGDTTATVDKPRDPLPAGTKTIADLPANSAMAQLTRASYFSEMAAEARTDEEAAAFADAAFNATVGDPVDLPVPASTPVLGVGDADIPRIEALRTQYHDALDKAQQTVIDAWDAEQRRDLANPSDAGGGKQFMGAERTPDKAKSYTARRLTPEDRKRLDGLNKELALKQERRKKERERLENTKKQMQDLIDEQRRRRNPGPNGPAPSPAHRNGGERAYVRGMEDGAQCMPSNGSSYCAGLSAKDMDACVFNYVSGYRRGESAKENKLREAHSIGEQVRRGDLPKNTGFNHKESRGPCRFKWLDAYDSGYQGTPFTMVGR